MEELTVEVPSDNVRSTLNLYMQNTTMTGTSETLKGAS